MTGAAPVPVPPPMPAATKHICAPFSASSTCAMLSSAAARPTSGREPAPSPRSEEHTSELQSLMRISYAVFCLKKKKKQPNTTRSERDQRAYVHMSEHKSL